jgi:hypothetical protein
MPKCRVIDPAFTWATTAPEWNGRRKGIARRLR